MGLCVTPWWCLTADLYLWTVKSPAVCTVVHCTCKCASACRHWSRQTRFLHRLGQGQHGRKEEVKEVEEARGGGGCAARHGEHLCQVHHKLSYTTLQDKGGTWTCNNREQKKDGGKVSPAYMTRQKHSSCDSLESSGNRTGSADLWQDEGRWRQLFQEAGGMRTCCGLYPPQA